MATAVIHVCSAAAALAKKLNVECPIIDGIFRVIHEKAEPLGVCISLLSSHPREFVHATVSAAHDQAVALQSKPDAHTVAVQLLWQCHNHIVKSSCTDPEGVWLVEQGNK